jgi:hypothetical protein
MKTFISSASSTDAAAAQVIAKYTRVLGAVDVFTTSNRFAILESIRLDLGYGSWIHPQPSTCDNLTSVR